MQAAARMASVVSLTLPARRRLIRNVSRCSRPVTTKQKSRKRKCTCNWLHNSAEDPDIPVVFDARLNEFHIQRNRDKGYSMVYFCPICGYAAPDSLRGSLFARIPHKEHRRLDELTQHLKTLDEVFSALGTPTRDEPYGLRIARPAKDDQPPTNDTYRVLVYTELSPVADVRVTVHSPERVRISYQAKYVGLPNDRNG